MTSIRTTIISNLIDHMKLVNGLEHSVPGCPFSPYTYKTNLYENVVDELRYLENINDFPTVSFFQTSSEQRFERGSEIYGTVTYLIRCFFMADDNDEQADDFIEDMQFSLNSFKYTQTSADLVDLKIMSVSTDEKILDPYGVAEISIGLVYRLTI